MWLKVFLIYRHKIILAVVSEVLIFQVMLLVFHCKSDGSCTFASALLALGLISLVFLKVKAESNAKFPAVIIFSQKILNTWYLTSCSRLPSCVQAKDKFLLLL